MEPLPSTVGDPVVSSTVVEYTEEDTHGIGQACMVGMGRVGAESFFKEHYKPKAKIVGYRTIEVDPKTPIEELPAGSEV